ncbi:tautomerase family protein [Xanthobacter oligotrophicus]|uniref:tautomerase family protein n=1 Tax=Xanthobacter oligotrophicus TaxID=2607286 RepID=UPI0011F15CAF|nr:tautomerase family protein [Xanthobacter oligotrophicus]MCG5237044.1 tautomerase family protein [Xanthobacter oligotrophicus]
MPLLDVKLSGTPDAALAATVATTLSDLTARILRKDPQVTAVAISFVPRDQWLVGGASLAQTAASSFSLDIQVVDGTNTKDEKAAYLEAVFAAMDGLLPDLDPESYILVREVKADAYGYGGRTQESRYVEKKLKVA